MTEQPSPREPKVVTFYSDVSDELDSHFFRALSATDLAGGCGSALDADQPSKVKRGAEARVCGKMPL